MLDLVGVAISIAGALGKLYGVVMEVKDMNDIFKPTLSRLAETIDILIPLVNELDYLNKLLKQTYEESTDLKSDIEEGEKLVRKCSKVPSWNLHKRYKYAFKLVDLDRRLKDLKRYCCSARDNKEILILSRIASRNGVNGVQEVYISYDHDSAPGERHDDLQEYYRSVSTFQYDVSCPSFIVGLDAPLEELKKNFLNDNRVSITIVTASGGCGKTVLAQKFCLDNQVQEKFKENIFFITVSKMPPSLCLIVRDLYKYKYKTNSAPPLQNETDGAKSLENFLKKLKSSPILMVLDDVWPGSESLIQKFAFRRKDYKILITSRSALPKFHHKLCLPLRLSPLNDEDAMNLFLHLVRWNDGTPYGRDDDIVKKIVATYKRIPLALQIVARSLIGQPAEIWLKRREECSADSSSRPNSEKQLLASLISNLDYSDALSKKCRKDLALFPENWIPVAALIDMWTELYVQEGSCFDIISNLKAKSMVILKITRKDAEEVDDYYSQHFVIPHNALREVDAKKISEVPIGQKKRLSMNLNGDELPEWWNGVEQPVSARLVSISTDEMFSSNWLDMKLPEAEVLVLNFQTKKYALPNFVKSMKKLKVLIATKISKNVEENYAELSHFKWLRCLIHLKRIRLERISIPSLSKDPLPWENLQKISLYMCSIGEAFGNCSTRISNLLPNLREVNVDFCTDLVELPVGLCDIIHLKNLSITHCTKLSALPEDIGKLVNLQVLRLRLCSNLKELPNSIGNLSRLTSLDIYECDDIEKLPEAIGNLPCLTNVNLNHCSRLHNLPSTFWNLGQSIDLVCGKLQKEVWEKYQFCPQNITMRSALEGTNSNWP